jgi:Domain of unknown function (DUF4382)
MSFGRRTATYATTAAVLAVAIIAIAALSAGPSTSSSTNLLTGTKSTTQLSPSQDQGQTQTRQVISTSTTASQQASSSTLAGAQALLLVQLTDPPVVPAGTTSLNLTYSAIDVIVAEPGQNNQVTTTDVTVTPQGGSATVDLLQLQNVSQTIATASIPANSTIYSFSFTVTGISIAVNGTTSAATLATGANALQVTLASPALVGGTTAALLQLNPVIADTPTGYQMIPSAVAITKGGSLITDQDKVIGSRHQLTWQDNSDLHDSRGQVSATLVGLSSAGTTTTVTVQVNNTGGASIQLVAIGLHGNFTMQNPGCKSEASTTSSSSSSTSTTSSHGEQGSGNRNNTGGAKGNSHSGVGSCNDHGGNELVFVPQMPGSATTSTSSSSSTTGSSSSSSSSSTTTSTTSASASSTTTAASCTTGTLALSQAETSHDRGLTLSPGQCVTLTFTGVVSFGESQTTVVPSTAPGQTYALHVVASDSAETTMSCALPLTPTSCTLANPTND